MLRTLSSQINGIARIVQPEGMGTAQGLPLAVMTTRSILHQIACRGYAVRMRRAEGAVVIEAIALDDPSQRHVSRSLDGEGENEARRAACALAKMVGIELDGDAGSAAGEPPAC